MKKNIRLLAVVLAIGLLCAFLVSCTKTPLNSDTFKAIAQNKEYSTTDALSQYSSDERFKEVFIAYPSGKPFQIEFYVLDSADSAKSIFNNQANIIESQRGNLHSSSSINGKNFAKRTMVSDGKYTMVEYVENTLVFVPLTDSDNKETIEQFLKEMNY